jgi:hypothetical protein
MTLELDTAAAAIVRDRSRRGDSAVVPPKRRSPDER